MTSITQTPKRTGLNLSVYLILWKGNETLLLERKNTGYCDGMYGLVAGHVEDGESALQALVREAQEEAGIEVDVQDVHFVHVMHRKSNRHYIDLFFECRSWKGTPVNREPEKCSRLEFFPKDQLPSNLIGYVKEVLTSNHFYSEQGWNS